MNYQVTEYDAKQAIDIYRLYQGGAVESMIATLQDFVDRITVRSNPDNFAVIPKVDSVKPRKAGK